MAQTGPDKVGFFGRLARDFRAARVYSKSRSQARKLTGQRQQAERDLQTLFVELGQSASDAGVGGDLPAFAAVAQCRQRLADAQALLAERQSASKSADDALAAETAKHQGILANLQAEYKPMADAAKAAHQVVEGLGRELESQAGQIAKAQGELDRLGPDGQSPEPMDSLQQRLAELSERHKGTQSRLESARGAALAADSAAKSKAAEVRAAEKTLQNIKAKCQSELSAAQALTTPDKGEKVKAAEDKLAAETAKQTDIINALMSESSQRQSAAHAATQQVDAVAGELSAAEDEGRKVQAAISGIELRQKLADLGQARQLTSTRLAEAQEDDRRNAASAQAKADELGRAEQVWREVKGQVEAALAAARSAEGEAAKAVESAGPPLTEALRAFGEAVFQSGASAPAAPGRSEIPESSNSAPPWRSPAVDPILARAREVVAHIADLDGQITALNQQADAAHGGATRFKLFAAAGLVILAGVGVGVYFLVRLIWFR